MYADISYYMDEYAGNVFEDADTFRAYERRAERRIDSITGRKLLKAFPEEEKDADAVRDCVCELAEFLYSVDRYQEASVSGMGAVQQEDGTMLGKVITSITSGSESRSYSVGGNVSTAVSEAAKDRKVLDITVYTIVCSCLSGVADANGVHLLFAGVR